MDHGLAVTWDDIAGLEFVKKTVKEIVIWPMLRPCVFFAIYRQFVGCIECRDTSEDTRKPDKNPPVINPVLISGSSSNEICVNVVNCLKRLNS